MRERLAHLTKACDEGRLEGFYILSRERAAVGAPLVNHFHRAGLTDEQSSFLLISALLSIHLDWMPR